MAVRETLANNHAADLASAQSLGVALENADKVYRDAIKTGKEDKIAEAKLKRDKAEQGFMAFMASTDKENDIIMQIINMIRD